MHTSDEKKEQMKRRVLRFAPLLMLLVVALVGLASPVSAVTSINDTVGPILDDVVLLIPTIIDLVIAIVPAIIVMSVVGFVVKFWDSIIGMLKF